MSLTLSLWSPGEIIEGVAERAKRRRLDLGYTQAELSERSGVRLGTLKLFERTGQASLQTVVMIAFALRAEGELNALFPRQAPMTIDDVVEKPLRQRGRRRRARAGSAT